MSKHTSDEKMDFADEPEVDLEKEPLTGKAQAGKTAPRYVWPRTIFLAALAFLLIGGVIWRVLTIAS